MKRRETGSLLQAKAPMDTKLPEISELDVLPDKLGALSSPANQSKMPPSCRNRSEVASRQDWTPLHLAGVRHDEDAEAVAALLELSILASPKF